MKEEPNEQTALKDRISIEIGNIADRKKLKKLKIDAIVNAANPTLMGSNQGVDYAIHGVINIRNAKVGFFKEKICEELNTDEEEKQIRCRRGEAVLTGGYGLCSYVIHAVGAEYDGAVRADSARKRGTKRGDKVRRRDMCSSSMVHTLECCYEQIVERIMEHADIKRAAVPVIGAGHYQVPFRIAFQIAAASIYNALLEWKQKDPEMFEMSAPEHVYFFIYDERPEILERNKNIADEILSVYGEVMDRERRIVFQTTQESHYRCLKEVQKYDHKRGYFSAARRVRLLVLWIRSAFLPLLEVKDRYGGADWSKRRKFVECLAVVKLAFAAAACLLAYWCTGRACLIQPVPSVIPAILGACFSVLIIYCMSDTITYLLFLILLADVQGPSANVTRSIILLVVNFAEICLEMTYLFFIYCEYGVSMREAAFFGILGSMEQSHAALADDLFRYAGGVIRFFFLTVAFGYLSGHMNQKKFRS